MKKKQNDGTNRHSLFLHDAISSPAASRVNHSVTLGEEKERDAIVPEVAAQILTIIKEIDERNT